MAAMKKLSVLLAAAVLPVISPVHASEPAPTGPFTLPELPYAYDALEPHIDTETMKIHHNKHHAAYVNNANKALAGHPDLSKLTVWELVAHLDEVPEGIRTTLRNNAGGHANHSLFWLMMKPGGGGEPTGDLAEACPRTARAAGCLFFTTVLGPGSNDAHDDHLHLDVAARRGGWRLCQ